jgi:6-phosphogluconolactonase (cycloisomerase 2 family)
MRAAIRIGFLVVLAGVASSCGGGSSTQSSTNPTPSCTPATQPKFAYVLNYSDATISMYTVNSCTGALTATTPATVPTGVNNGFNAEGMAIDPMGRFLYVANLGSNAYDAGTISMFTINPTTGILTPTSPAMVATGYFPQGITVDASGKFVYTANSDDNSVSMFSIDQISGVLTPTAPAAIAVPAIIVPTGAGSSPGFVTSDPSGRFLYVTDQDNGSVSSFKINSTTGTLTPTTPAGISSGAYPFKVTLDPSGKFAYVPDENSNYIWMFTVDSNTGVLTPNQALAVSAGNQPGWVAVDPASKFAYAVNRIDNTISMYTIAPITGTLTPNTPATVKTGNGPYPIAVNSAGTFAYVANQQDGTVSIYRIETNGILSPAGYARAGNDPLGIAMTR